MKARDVREARAAGRARRTYSCLEGRRRKPSDYEITTTALLYYPDRGFEVRTPVWEHYVAFQQRGQLRAPVADAGAPAGEAWDRFEDPAHTTYSSYVARRRDQEAHLDRLFERPPAPPAPGLEPLLGVLSALRFPLHALQMTAAYVGALAPGGRVTVAAAFQAADEMRRIQRLCQWLSRSAAPISELDALGRELWQRDAAFQPLRRLSEELLVTFDWGEALVGMNGVIKPVFDRLIFENVAAAAKRHDDEVLEQTARSLGEDSRWHEAWFGALARLLTSAQPDNATAVARIVTGFRPRALSAAAALSPIFERLAGGAAEPGAGVRLARALDEHLAPLGVAEATTGGTSDDGAR